MKITLLALALVAMAAAPSAQTTSTFDPASGTGFLAKGDVQLALGWNNRDLQNGAAGLVVTYSAEEISEVSWVCTNSNNENTQERERTTTSTVSGVTTATARVRNQITGFFLEGFSGSTSSSTTDGPAVNSCPSGPWSLTTPAGDPQVVSTTGGLFVNGVAL